MEAAKSTLLERARSLAPELVELRRDLHRHPELSFQEQRTARVVAERLEAMGLEARRGIARTGVVAEIGDGQGPVVALRADMDALPIQEQFEHDYGSTVPGVMHACGHDAHTAGLIGTARLLVAERDAGRLPPGTIRLLFQPSEEAADDEGKSGATRMIEDGALERVRGGGRDPRRRAPPARQNLRRRGLDHGGFGRDPGRGARALRARPPTPSRGSTRSCSLLRAWSPRSRPVARAISPMEPGVVTFGTIQGGRANNVIRRVA